MLTKSSLIGPDRFHRSRQATGGLVMGSRKLELAALSKRLVAICPKLGWMLHGAARPLTSSSFKSATGQLHRGTG